VAALAAGVVGGHLWYGLSWLGAAATGVLQQQTQALLLQQHVSHWMQHYAACAGSHVLLLCVSAQLPAGDFILLPAAAYLSL
jgi:hypothetical protein